MTQYPASTLESFSALPTEPERWSTRSIDRVAYASDASHFLLTPQGVLTAGSAEEVAAAMQTANRTGAHLSFRSGGTSLSGQASTDGIVIDTRKHFRSVTVLDNGKRVRVQPGATVRQVNAHLMRHGYRLGPDPASESACTIGGVIANNSSGMACGTTENTYQTLESAVLVLPSGTVIDTADADANSKLRELEPELFAGLERLKQTVRGNPHSVQRIEQQFSMKNTMGYGINSFLDFNDPVSILLHLVIGSEGTLAFVAEATFRTVPVQRNISTALVMFPSLQAATSSLPGLVESGAATLELMDSTSIRVGQSLPTPPTEIQGIDPAGNAALLVEYHSNSVEELDTLRRHGEAVLAESALLSPPEFTTELGKRNVAWAFRKGLYASVAGARASGTTALLEDVVVPVPELAQTCASLQELFTRYNYDDGVIFGHAKDGNVHFMITDRFEGDSAMQRYVDFTEDMVDLILNASGSLKAEHGTGRVMAPYVRRQYGDELYAVMCEIKQLCDPNNVLNPGVIINDDPRVHLKHIKLAETVEEEVDRCVECGYCEPVCPSRDLTLTPRQRIVVKRAMAQAEKDGDSRLLNELSRDYDYEGVQTCAADGMCAVACPVQINTGDLVRRLRAEQQNKAAALGWNSAAKHWAPVTRTGATMLTLAKHVPTPLVTAATTVGRAVLGKEQVPQYSKELPGGGASRKKFVPGVGDLSAPPAALYLPACVNSMFGPEGGGIGVGEAFARLAQRAGVHLIVPENIESLCCSTPWTSKGYPGGRSRMLERALKTAVKYGTSLTVISDATSCTEGYIKMFEEVARDTGISISVEDALAFTVREILPRIPTPDPQVDHLVLHPTCSSLQLGLNDALVEIAESVAGAVTVPTSWACCGYAGDRGMLHPELTDSATREEAAEVKELQADAFASCNRTCELGMKRATDEDYVHVLELLEKATRGTGQPQ